MLQKDFNLTVFQAYKAQVQTVKFFKEVRNVNISFSRVRQSKKKEEFCDKTVRKSQVQVCRYWCEQNPIYFCEMCYRRAKFKNPLFLPYQCVKSNQKILRLSYWSTFKSSTGTLVLNLILCQGVFKWAFCKGQIKPKADWCTVDFPKKRTNKFVQFAFLLITAKKKQICKFVLWENLRRARTAFGFI